VSDLRVLLPELVLSAAGLVLIVGARRIARAGVAAGLAIAAAAVAVGSGFAFSTAGPPVGFGGTVTADGYALFFKVLFSVNLAVVSLLSVSAWPRRQHGKQGGSGPPSLHLHEEACRADRLRRGGESRRGVARRRRRSRLAV
jgi:NADH:ubiquinone oxidoreductase subunit 2 (subunit N)